MTREACRDKAEVDWQVSNEMLRQCIARLEAALDERDKEIAKLREALEPFKSGEWGAWKAWLVEGAPTREEGILAAKTLTKYQYGVDEVLSQHERGEAR